MHAQDALKAVASLKEELASIESTWKTLDERRNVLLTIIDGYRQLFPSEHFDLPGGFVILPTESEVPKRRRGSTANRVVAVMKAAEPQFLGARDILNKLQASGWETRSNDPISIVRNTLVEMNKTGLLDRKDRGDGSLGYRLKNPDAPVSAGASELPNRTEGGDPHGAHRPVHGGGDSHADLHRERSHDPSGAPVGV